MTAPSNQELRNNYLANRAVPHMSQSPVCAPIDKLFAEFETNLRRERQMEGIAEAKARGVYAGKSGITIDAWRFADFGPPTQRQSATLTTTRPIAPRPANRAIASPPRS